MARKARRRPARRPKAKRTASRARGRRAKPKRRAKPRARPRAKAKPRPRRTARPARRGAARPTRPAPRRATKARATPTVRVFREELEEETVCSLEFLSDGRSFIARLETNRGGIREHRAPTFSDLLELVAEDLREELLEA